MLKDLKQLHEEDRAIAAQIAETDDSVTRRVLLEQRGTIWRQIQQHPGNKPSAEQSYGVAYGVLAAPKPWPL